MENQHISPDPHCNGLAEAANKQTSGAIRKRLKEAKGYWRTRYLLSACPIAKLVEFPVGVEAVSP